MSLRIHERSAQTLSACLLALPTAVKAVRTARGLSLRDCADEMGIAFNNLYRFENGGNCTLSTVLAALRWMEGA